MDYGLAIDDIVIEGREKTVRDDLIEKIGLSRNDNILDTDLGAIKKTNRRTSVGGKC